MWRRGKQGARPNFDHVTTRRVPPCVAVKPAIRRRCFHGSCAALFRFRRRFVPCTAVVVELAGASSAVPIQTETSKKPTAVDTAPVFEVRESRSRAWFS